ncbi:MAG: hypothetical protein Kow00127_05740 [Bacteroidales bacterium]
MKKIYQSVVLFFLMVTLFSCTERIDIELDSTYERLVVEAYLSTDTMAHPVRLSKSADYLDTEKPPAVTGAVVQISDSDSAVILTENPDKPGMYITPENYAGVPGKTYKLIIDLPEKIGGYDHYEAESTIRPVASIDSIRVVYEPDWELYQVQIFAWEPPTTDFYKFDILKNGELLTDTINKAFVSDDRFFNGNYTYGITVGVLDPNNERENPEPGDTITLSMSSITEDYYNFLIELQDQTFQFRNPLFSGPPANIRTNIPNAHGYFSAFSLSKSSYIMPPEFK